MGILQDHMWKLFSQYHIPCLIPLVPLILFFYTGCKNTEKQTESENQKQSMISELAIKTMAVEKLGEGVFCAANESANLILCQNKNPRGQSVFVVYQKDSAKAIYEQLNPVQKVSWYDNEQLNVMPLQGIAEKNIADNTMLLNPVTGKKIQVNKQF